MPGAFNITRLLAELGLKNVQDLPITERIQPTISVGDLSDVTPPHVAPSAIFGDFQAALVLFRALFEFQCLAPGGAFVEWISWESAVANGNIRIRPAAIGPGLAVLPVAGQASRDPIVSIGRSGVILPSGLPSGAIINANAVFVSFSPRPMFIPRGQFLSVESGATNAAVGFGMGWREVPASEHVPS